MCQPLNIRFAMALVSLIYCKEGLGVNINSEFGVIASDNFPSPYPDNIDKSWNITTRPGFKIRLHFTSFDLEDSYEEEGGSCVYDYVQINGYKRLCGNYRKFPSDAPAPGQVFESSDESMTVQFVSDYSNEPPKPVGFQAHFQTEDRDECEELRQKVNSGIEDWDELLFCNHHCNNVPGSYYCTCRHGFTLDENRHTCRANCPSEPIVAGMGFITSTDYPNPYSKLADCVREIRAETGYSLDIRFDSQFAIEDHYEEGCSYDWVKVTSENGSSIRYCGTTAPHNATWIDMRSSVMSVQFHSDLSIEKTGYKLYYRIKPYFCDPDAVVTPANGRKIEDTGSNDTYIYNNAVTFQCNVGYRLVGNNRMKCLDKGRWSASPPSCQIKHCRRPTHLLNITNTVIENDVGENPEYGTALNISCIPWYERISGSGDWFCGDDEEWHVRSNPNSIFVNESLPVCRPNCGLKGQKASVVGQQIIGGKYARVGEWPWMAYLDIGGNGLDARKSFCGGSLVEEQYVVTAAHCVEKLENFYVYLGVTNRASPNNQNMQRFTAMEVNVQEGYINEFGNASYNHDIAVVKLDRPAVIGQYVRPICIPRSTREKELPERGLQGLHNYQDRGVVTGWGLTEFNQPAMHLQMVRVPVVSKAECLREYKKESGSDKRFKGLQITNNMICAGFRYKTKDSCFGDSGGPYMFRDLATNKWFLNGIVSYGTNYDMCDKPNILGIYTKVANYIEFLDTYIL